MSILSCQKPVDFNFTGPKQPGGNVGTGSCHKRHPKPKTTVETLQMIWDSLNKAVKRFPK